MAEVVGMGRVERTGKRAGIIGRGQHEFKGLAAVAQGGVGAELQFAGGQAFCLGERA